MPQVPDSYLIESGQLVIHTGNPRVDHAARIANLAAAKANGVKPGPPPTYSPTARLYLSGARKMMLRLPANSVDALVTDPPAGISFMGKQWDTPGKPSNANAERDHDAATGRGERMPRNPNGRVNQPFGYSGSTMPEVGDRQRFISSLTPIFAQALRVCKPGAVALVWALPRTSHWTATALEDAGWVIEDRITHLFGTGFPKGKARLKPACEDWWLCRKPGPLWLGVEECRVEGPVDAYARPGGGLGSGHVYDGRWNVVYDGPAETHPDSARHHARGRWPPHVVLSHHPECVCRGTKRVAGNMGVRGSDAGNSMYGGGKGLSRPNTGQQVGYAGPDGLEEVEDWECHPDCAVRLLDEQSGTSCSSGGVVNRGRRSAFIYGDYASTEEGGTAGANAGGLGDTGGASRFFYCAKPSTSEREAGLETLPKRAHSVGNTEAAGRDPANPNNYQADSKRERVSQGLPATQPRANIHPTVKSISLMRWLIRLACPVRGTVLDPFMGSGTTGCAALLEGRNFVGCDNHYEYFEIANARVSHWSKRS
jgi:DNA modification methylase